MQILGQSLNITEALLAYLEELFPNKLPTHQVTPNEIAFLQGQRHVVATLVELFNQQFEKE